MRDEAGSSSSHSHTATAPIPVRRPWRIEPDGTPSLSDDLELTRDRERETATGTPPARLRHADSKELLINSYEAEEERIINSLVRKLEEVSVVCSASNLFYLTWSVAD